MAVSGFGTMDIILLGAAIIVLAALVMAVGGSPAALPAAWSAIMDHGAYGAILFFLICAAFMGAALVRGKRTRAFAFFVPLALLCASLPLYTQAVKAQASGTHGILANLAAEKPSIFGGTGRMKLHYMLYFPLVLDNLVGKTGARPDWYGYALTCQMRGVDMDSLRGRPDECRSLNGIRQAFGIDMRRVLTVDYMALKSYAGRLSAAGRGAHGKGVAGLCSNVMPGFYFMDHSGGSDDQSCVCLTAPDGGQGGRCPAIRDVDLREGLLYELARNDFFTSVTCPLSATCDMLLRDGVDVGLADIAVMAGAGDVAAIKAACLRPDSAGNRRSATYCDCLSEGLAASSASFSRPGLACLRRTANIFSADCAVSSSDIAPYNSVMIRCATAEQNTR